MVHFCFELPSPDAQSLEACLPMLYTFVRLSGLNHPTMQHDTPPHTSTWGTWYNAPYGIIGSFACTRRVYRFQAQAINQTPCGFLMSVA